MQEKCSVCLRDREIGHIEGRLEAMEKRVTALEEMIKDGFDTVNKRLDAIVTAIEPFKMDKARRAGGIAVLTIMVGIMSILGGFFGNLLQGIWGK